MTKPGPARRPTLQVVREGNPGHASKERLETLQLPPGVPAEPDWQEWFGPVRAPAKATADQRGRARLLTAENKRARERARREWRSVVKVLDAQGLLARVDDSVLTNHCLTVARILVCERDISRRGVWVDGDRGAVKNPSVTAVNQYRTFLKFSIGELGLSPAARAEFGMAGDPGDADSSDGTYDV